MSCPHHGHPTPAVPSFLDAFLGPGFLNSSRPNLVDDPTELFCVFAAPTPVWLLQCSPRAAKFFQPPVFSRVDRGPPARPNHLTLFPFPPKFAHFSRPLPQELCPEEPRGFLRSFSFSLAPQRDLSYSLNVGSIGWTRPRYCPGFLLYNHSLFSVSRTSPLSPSLLSLVSFFSSELRSPLSTIPPFQPPPAPLKVHDNPRSLAFEWQASFPLFVPSSPPEHFFFLRRSKTTPLKGRAHNPRQGLFVPNPFFLIPSLPLPKTSSSPVCM